MTLYFKDTQETPDNAWATVANWWTAWDGTDVSGAAGALPAATDNVIFLSDLNVMGAARTCNTATFGDSANSVTANFVDTTHALTCTAGATFNDASCNNGTIAGAAVFPGTAYSVNPQAGSATSTTFTNNVVFTIGGLGGQWLGDTSEWDFQGTCTYIFNSGGDMASGAIGGNATFNAGSTCSSGTINGNATFKSGSGGAADQMTIGALANVTFESGSTVGAASIYGTVLFELGTEAGPFWGGGMLAEGGELTTYMFDTYAYTVSGTLIVYGSMCMGTVGAGVNAHLEMRGGSGGDIGGTFGSLDCYDSYFSPWGADLTVIDPVVMRGTSYVGTFAGWVFTADVHFYDSARAWSDVLAPETYTGSLTFHGTEYAFNPAGEVTASGGITFPNPVVFNMTGPIAEWGAITTLQTATFLDTVEWKISTLAAAQSVADSYFTSYVMPPFVIELPALDVLGTGLL